MSSVSEYLRTAPTSSPWYQTGSCQPSTARRRASSSSRKYSDTLLICLLKAHHPEKYADRSENKTTLSGAVEISHSLAPELQSVLDSVYGAKPEEPAK